MKSGTRVKFAESENILFVFSARGSCAATTTSSALSRLLKRNLNMSPLPDAPQDCCYRGRRGVKPPGSPWRRWRSQSTPLRGEILSSPFAPTAHHPHPRLDVGPSSIYQVPTLWNYAPVVFSIASQSTRHPHTICAKKHMSTSAHDSRYDAAESPTRYAHHRDTHHLSNCHNYKALPLPPAHNPPPMSAHQQNCEWGIFPPLSGFVTCTVGCVSRLVIVSFEQLLL